MTINWSKKFYLFFDFWKPYQDMASRLLLLAWNEKSAGFKNRYATEINDCVNSAEF
jgi:hypothetical protein